MQFITDFLTELLGPAGPILALGGIGIVLVVATLPILLRKQVDPLDKIKELRQGNSKKVEKADLRVAQGSNKLEKYSAFLEPQDEAEYSAIQLKLLQAGYPGKNAVQTYHFLQLALAIGLMVVGIFITILKTANDQELTTQARMMWILGPGALGYLFPKYWVTRRVEERQEEITNGFPDALDMMLVCVEAGQSLDQAILRVAKEIRPSYPALSDEFTIVSNETKAGKDRVQVLRDMAERSGVADVASFVTVMIQSATFGTSIAEALRVYAGEMRDKRVMRAEEKANKLPTKMTLATMMLTVPPLLIILIGPSVYGVAQTLSNIRF
ncbi:tight adherence protein C [Aliiroseovarius halocynthiae]|uniref:Type II secretion system F family protein n=1 Tax=Aliiroseovarius halocynthiae TaxID=985055 RepID=A0A545SV33_9RHOB|nr:type II secretion system F family protein [Aliiroseovarius halocynthiae]TQV68818.1 type II secretion system F family protein [Aliiroseovarius halocynthiae]SMR71246.1 tight adherence protein C [Aliiroseovarius halocynthiae]